MIYKSKLHKFPLSNEESYNEVQYIIESSLGRTADKIKKEGLWNWILWRISPDQLVLCRHDTEIIFIAMHPEISCICKYGNHKYFYSLIKGFGERCGNDECNCHIEWRESESWKTRSKIAQSRREHTLEENWGVRNPSQSPEIQNRKIETNQKNWGVDWAPQAIAVKEKNKTTTLANWGCEYFWQTPESRNRLQEYRDTHLEEILRHTNETNLKNRGVLWTLQDPVVRSKMMDTNMVRRGYSFTMQDPEFQAKLKQILIDKYKVDNPALIPGFREKVVSRENERTGRDWPSQRQYSQDVYDILSDPITLQNEINKCGVQYLSKTWKIEHCTIYKYIRQYDLTLKENNQYEYEISNWLSELNINFLRNDRKQIKPFELDFWMPQYNIAIEFQGSYWHMDPNIFESADYNRSTHKTAKQHWIADQKKADLCLKQNINLIIIWENDWNQNKDLIKQNILNKIKENNK